MTADTERGGQCAGFRLMQLEQSQNSFEQLRIVGAGLFQICTPLGW